MDKLIEMIVDVGGERCGSNNNAILVAEDMLSVIRQNVHLVAKVCWACKGYGIVDTIGYGGVGEQEKCNVCKGHGVVPVKESPCQTK